MHNIEMLNFRLQTYLFVPSTDHGTLYEEDDHSKPQKRLI